MSDGGYEFDSNGCVWSSYPSALQSFFDRIHCAGSDGMILGYPVIFFFFSRGL